MKTVAKEDHVSPLAAMLYPGYTKRCDHCGGLVATTPEEALRRWTETAYEPIAKLAAAFFQPAATPTSACRRCPGTAPGRPTGRAASGLTGTTTAAPHVHHRHQHHDGCGCDDDCGCRDCHRHDCHCECCVINVDLVINARLGERRVVPLTVENSRRREREISLELSEFTRRAANPRR